MLQALAFVPSAPLLLPGLGGGPADLRAAVERAAAALTGRVTVLGAAPESGPARGTVDLTGFGVPGEPAPDPLPLALAVGSCLRPDASLHGVAPSDDPGTAVAGLDADALLVVADGTAKRTEKAPGHLDARAEGFDAAVEQALRTGDPDALAGLDPVLAEQLWVGGLPAWRAAAVLAAGASWRAELLWSGAPFGVGYAVAVWRRM